MRIEWRSKAEGDDSLLAVNDEGSSVVRVWTADASLITDFLNDMVTLDTQNGRNGLDLGQRDPQSWGKLILARSDSGDLLHVDPELYWDKISYWFRSRGADPNRWRKD